MTSSDSVVRLDNTIRRVGNIASILIYSAAMLLTLVTALIPPMFSNWTSEYTLFTFGTSLQYFMAAAVAFVCFWITTSLNKCGSNRKYRAWLWLPLAAGFFYGSADEILTIHENVGTSLENVPLVKNFYSRHASDLFIISYAVGALLFTVVFIRELWQVKKSLFFYCGGLVLVVLAASIDTLLVNTTQYPILVYTEELAEFYAGTTFTVAFLYYALDRSRLVLLDLRDLYQHPEKKPITVAFKAR